MALVRVIAASNGLHSVLSGHVTCEPRGEERRRHVRQVCISLGTCRPLSEKNATVSSTNCPTVSSDPFQNYHLPWPMRWSFGMSYFLFLSLVFTHKNIQRTENIVNLALRAGSGRRTYVRSTRHRMRGGNDRWSTACQLNELHSFRFPHKIHFTGDLMAHCSQLQSNSSAREAGHPPGSPNTFFGAPRFCRILTLI